MVIASRLGRGGRHAQGVTTNKVMGYVVYILYNETRARYYVGQTQDINERLERHNKGLVKSTKTGIPWKLILTVPIETRSEALILERKIKNRGAERFIKDNQFGV